MLMELFVKGSVPKVSSTMGKYVIIMSVSACKGTVVKSMW